MKKKFVKISSICVVIVVVFTLGFTCFADFVSNAPLGGDGWDTLKECHNGYTLVFSTSYNQYIDKVYTLTNGNRIPLRSADWNSFTVYTFWDGEYEFSFLDDTWYDLDTNLATHSFAPDGYSNFIDFAFNPFVWTSSTDMYFTTQEEDIPFKATIIGDAWLPNNDGTYSLESFAFDYDGLFLDLDEWDIFASGTIFDSLFVHIYDLDSDYFFDARFSMIDEDIDIVPVVSPNVDLSDDVSFFESIFGWTDDFFSVKLFGSVSLGMILGVMIVIPLAVWLLKVVAGG